MYPTANMGNPQANLAAAVVAGPNSDATTSLHDGNYLLGDLEYIVDRANQPGMADQLVELLPNSNDGDEPIPTAVAPVAACSAHLYHDPAICDDILCSLQLYIDFMRGISNEAPSPSESLLSIPSTLSEGISFTQTMDPSLLLGDGESSTPPNGATPALDSSGEEDPDIEQEDPFSLRRRSDDGTAITEDNAKDEGQHDDNDTTTFSNNLDEEGGAEDGKAFSSAAEASSSNEVGAESHTAPCPGLAGRSDAERAQNLDELLQTADKRGRKDRDKATTKITRTGRGERGYTCTECPKTDRYSRVLAHVLSVHLHMATWACPHCGKAYAAKENLSHHLKAVRVLCLCGKSISKNNWYPHAKICKRRPVDDARVLKLRQGKVVSSLEQTAAPAEPSQELPRPVGGTAQKRKAPDVEESDDERERKIKRVKPNEI